MDVYCLKAHESKTVDKFPEGLALLRENYAASRQRRPTLEERITRLEIGSSYGCSTNRLVQMYTENLQIPELVSAIGALVKAMASQQQVSSTSETFGVEIAAEKLGCSPAFVRELVHSNKLQHRWVGKNLKFRQEYIDAYWSSETRIGTNKKKIRAGRITYQNYVAKAGTPDKDEPEK